MSYRVLFTDAFHSDVAEHVDHLRRQHVSGETIERWYDRLFTRLDDLGTWPRSHPVDDHMTAEFGREVRKLVYARYVVTYHVD